MIPEKLKAWSLQPGTVLDPAEEEFVRLLGHYFRDGIGYGFAQQVIEWMWQELAEADGVPGSAWGPEYFNARVAELEKRNAELVAACEAALKLWDREEPIYDDQGEVAAIRAAVAKAKGN